MAYDLGVHARRSQEPLSDTEQTLASIRTKLSDSNYLIVAVGIKLNWKAIKGLNVDQVGKNGICSNYLYDGCEGHGARCRSSRAHREFDYDLKPTPRFPFDSTKEHWSMYQLKRYVLPALYGKGMLKGLA